MFGVSQTLRFYSLLRMKKWLMTQQRLNHVAVLHTHQEKLDALVTSSILSDFITVSDGSSFGREMHLMTCQSILCQQLVYSQCSKCCFKSNTVICSPLGNVKNSIVAGSTSKHDGLISCFYLMFFLFLCRPLHV